MLPFILAAAAIALVAKALEPNSTNKKKRVFISFAVEDERYRNFLVEQSKLSKSPFEFIDMSVKEPWDEDVWKEKCRTKIKRSDLVLVLLSKSTWHASGVRWEAKCANEEGVPVVGMYVQKKKLPAIIPEVPEAKVITWSWQNLDTIINK